jgi:hypothetical protein
MGPSVKPETLKQLLENIGKTLEDIGVCNYFSTRIPVAKEIKARIDAWSHKEE